MFIERGAQEHKQAIEKAAEHRRAYEEMIKNIMEDYAQKNYKSDQVKYVAYEIEEKRQYDVMNKNVHKDLDTEKTLKKLEKEEKKTKKDRNEKHQDILYRAKVQKYETDVENLKNKRLDQRDLFNK